MWAATRCGIVWIVGRTTWAQRRDAQPPPVPEHENKCHRAIRRGTRVITLRMIPGPSDSLANSFRMRDAECGDSAKDNIP